MSAILDTVFDYTGYGNGPSRCRIRLYHLASGIMLVIASELPDNCGTPMTNFAAELATAVREWFVEPGRGMFWIEYNPGQGNGQAQETFNRVLFRWDGHQYTDPQRKRWSRRQVEALIGEALEDREPAA